MSEKSPYEQLCEVLETNAFNRREFRRRSEELAVRLVQHITTRWGIPPNGWGVHPSDEDEVIVDQDVVGALAYSYEHRHYHFYLDIIRPDGRTALPLFVRSLHKGDYVGSEATVSTNEAEIRSDADLDAFSDSLFNTVKLIWSRQYYDEVGDEPPSAGTHEELDGF